MFCKECKAEYLEGITECAGCGIPLVEELEIETKQEEQIEELIQFGCFPDLYEAQLAKDAFYANGIEAEILSREWDGLHSALKNTVGGNSLLIKAKDANAVQEFLDHLPEPDHQEEWTRSRFYKICVKPVCEMILLAMVFNLGAIVRQYFNLLF